VQSTQNGVHFVGQNEKNLQPIKSGSRLEIVKTINIMIGQKNVDGIIQQKIGLI
jgi:hypothetical protein